MLTRTLRSGQMKTLSDPQTQTKAMSTSAMTAVETSKLGRESKGIPKWKTPGITQEELEWADILTVDLSLYNTRRCELIRTVATALQRDGFFYVVGHEISPGTVGDPYQVIGLR